MTTVEWPNPCHRCGEPLGRVSDADLIVDTSSGDMMHAEHASFEQRFDIDQKVGPLKRLEPIESHEITAVINIVRGRADALDAEADALWMYLQSRH